MGIGSWLENLFSPSTSNPGGFIGSITSLFEGIPKEIASAGIFSAASLVSQMFGRDVDGEQMDLAKQKFEQDVLNQQEMMAFNREELASRERIAKAAAGSAAAAANISANANKEIARRRNVLERGQTRVLAYEKAADRNAEAAKGKPELIMTGRTAQANQARAAGSEGQKAFESLMAGIQAGLRR